MEEKIKSGDWVYLKSNPEIRIKVRFINPNGSIDFRNQRSEEPLSAFLDEVVKITDENIIDELNIKYNY